jgi:hypothetical protein
MRLVSLALNHLYRPLAAPWLSSAGVAPDAAVQRPYL